MLLLLLGLCLVIVKSVELCSARVGTSESSPNLIYRVYYNEIPEVSAFSFVSTNFGVDPRYGDSIYQLLEFSNSIECHQPNPNEPQNSFLGITRTKYCSLNESRQLAIKFSLEGEVAQLQATYAYFTCELLQDVRFYVKTAAWCTFFGLYSLHRNCATFIFEEAYKAVNQAPRQMSTVPFEDNLLVFKEMYSLSWKSITEQDFSPSLFGINHVYTDQALEQFKNDLITWQIESAAYFRKCQQEYIITAVLYKYDPPGLGNELVLNSTWMSSISLMMKRVIATLNYSASAEVLNSELMEWVDLTLCIQVMINVHVAYGDYAVPASQEDLRNIFGMHLPEEGQYFHCRGSMHAVEGQWVPRFRDKPWEHQHLQSLVPVQAEYRDPRMYVSVYDWFAFVNIAHICNSGELFWSVAAASSVSYVLAEHLTGIVLFAFFPAARNREIRLNVLPFFRLYYRAMVRYCVEQGLEIIVDDDAFLKSVVNENFDAPQLMTNDVVHNLDWNLNLFPVLLERPVNNAMTPEGAHLMQSRMWLECTLSIESSPQRKYASSRAPQSEYSGLDITSAYDDYLRHTQHKPLAVLAIREGARHIANLDAVVDALVLFFQQSEATDILGRVVRLQVTVVDFGKISPCEQISIMNAAQLFVFVHGAEGSLVSFLPKYSTVIEVHPAGCCVRDFETPENYKYYYQPDAHATLSSYYFFSGTIASSWLCSTWLKHMMSSPYCGTVFLMDEFVEMLNFIYSLP